MQNFDITIAVNQVRKLNAKGSFFRYYSGSAAGLDETILVTYDGGSVFLKAGQSIRMPNPVSEWLISNYKKQAAIIGMVVVGDAEILDSNVSGSVSVIDGGFYRTLSGEAFIAAPSTTGSAGQSPLVQLWNPSGSGKNVIVEAISLSVSAASTVNVGLDAVQAAVAGITVMNKKSGMGVGAAVAKTGSVAYPYAGFVYGLAYQVAANVVQTINFAEPIMLSPNVGLSALASANMSAMYCNFEYFEQAI